jgi:hypothetical protein
MNSNDSSDGVFSWSAMMAWRSGTERGGGVSSWADGRRKTMEREEIAKVEEETKLTTFCRGRLWWWLISPRGEDDASRSKRRTTVPKPLISRLGSIGTHTNPDLRLLPPFRPLLPPPRPPCHRRGPAQAPTRPHVVRFPISATHAIQIPFPKPATQHAPRLRPLRAVSPSAPFSCTRPTSPPTSGPL